MKTAQREKVFSADGMYPLDPGIEYKTTARSCMISEINNSTWKYHGSEVIKPYIYDVFTDDQGEQRYLTRKIIAKGNRTYIGTMTEAIFGRRISEWEKVSKKNK